MWDIHVPYQPHSSRCDFCWTLYIWGGTQKTLELSSGGRAPCRRVFPSQVSVQGTHLDQCICWPCCKKLHSASVNFFKKFFQCVCPFHDGQFTSAPAHTTVSVQQFWPNTTWPLGPTLPIHLISPRATFLFPRMKKVLKGKHFANVEEVKQKVAEALKGNRIDECKNCFEQWEKCLNGYIASNGECFEGDWSLNM